MSRTGSVVFRPRRMRRVAWVLAPAVVVASVVLGLLLAGDIGAPGAGAVFHPSDRLAMIGLGLLGAGVILLFTRPRVEADERHIKVRNIVGGYDLPWPAVRAVRFDWHSPCLTLELQDDEVVVVLAVQVIDKDHAVEAVRSLRALHATANAAR